MTKYVAELKFIDITTCQVELPAHLANGQPEEVRDYRLVDGELWVNGSYKIPCPQYAIRAIIIVDIGIALTKRDMKFDMVLFNGKPVKNLRRVFVKNFDPNLSDEDVKKEIKLTKRVLADSTGIEPKEKLDDEIRHGYELFNDLVVCGGIK